MGIVLGAGIQLALGRGSDAATAALDWMSLVGTGYIDLLRMLVMPLVFVAIVGAFTRTKAVDNLGKIGGSVLAVLLITVAIAALFGWATIALSGLAGADFTQGSVDATKLDALQTRQDKVADTTIPQTILSMIPVNVFADLAGTRSTSTIAVVIFSAIVGLAYLKLRDRDSEQAQFFSNLIDSLYGIVMCIVKMVVGPYPLRRARPYRECGRYQRLRRHPRPGQVHHLQLRGHHRHVPGALAHPGRQPRQPYDVP